MDDDILEALTGLDDWAKCELASTLLNMTNLSPCDSGWENFFKELSDANVEEMLAWLISNRPEDVAAVIKRATK